MSKLYVPSGNVAKVPSKLIVPFNNTARSAIKAYGSYGGISRQIWPTKIGPTPGPWDPTNPNWDTLGEYVKAGNAQEILSIGQELPLLYNTCLINAVVLDFQNSTILVNGQEQVVPAVQMGFSVMQTTSTHPSSVKYRTSEQDWGDGAFEGSYISSVLNGSVLDDLEDSFVDNLGNAKFSQWLGTEDVVDYYARISAFSATELNIPVGQYNSAAQFRSEGKPLKYYVEGGSLAKNGINNFCNPSFGGGRWTRTKYSVGQTRMVVVGYDGSVSVDYYYSTSNPDGLVHFTGKY